MNYINIREKEFEKEHGYKANLVSEDGLDNISALYFNYCCKTEKWKQEDEYRIIFANPQI
ncbi:MAG: hypothetical protein K0R54_4457 [Clostridiaceae bacterium]|nr:hypothetical protein [Clostridiaceae bacterium]